MQKNPVIPKEWLKPFNYSNDVKLIYHWTAGLYTPGDLELDHYHFVIDGDGKVHKGFRDVGQPAPHTYGFNWEIGIGICCMAGAHPNYLHGKYPMKKVQWDQAINLGAQMVDHYSIPLSKDRVLTHAEVTSVLGVDQWGKWDIDELSFDSSIRDPATDLRTRITDMTHIDTRNSGMKMNRNVLVIQGKMTFKFEGILTNASTYIPIRSLEKQKILEISKVYRGKNGVLKARIGCVSDRINTSLVLIDGVGYVSVRFLEKLGYDVTYNHKEKVIRCTQRLPAALSKG